MKNFLLTLAASALALTATAAKTDWSYQVTPQEGEVEEIGEIQVVFPNIPQIDINSKDDITLSLNGKQLNGIKVTDLDEQTLSIKPAETLTASGTYTLNIAPDALGAYSEGYAQYFEDNKTAMTMTWTIPAPPSLLDFKYESSLPTEEYIAYFGELTLTFTELESVEYSGSGITVLGDGEPIDDVTVTTDANKLTLTLKDALNFVTADVEVVIAVGALNGEAAGITESNVSEITIEYKLATPVEYNLSLAISNPKPNADGEISADRSLESFFFYCEQKNLRAVSGTEENVTIRSEEGDYEATAHLRKASGFNADYSYFSAAFGKEPTYNGKYIITIERGAFGSETWLADPNYGFSNDKIELTFQLVDGADREQYSIQPLSIDPEEGSYVSGASLATVTLIYPEGVTPVKGAAATLAGINTSYRSTAEFKANGKGGYAVAFSPAPSENGKYLLTVGAGLFGDAGFIADGNGKGSAPLNLTYVIDEKSAVEAISASEAPATVFNMQGMRLSTSPSSLPAGLYIINGKKVIVK